MPAVEEDDKTDVLAMPRTHRQSERRLTESLILRRDGTVEFEDRPLTMPVLGGVVHDTPIFAGVGVPIAVTHRCETRRRF